MPSRPSSQPVPVATWSVSAGAGSSCPFRRTRTRPGRSVSQMAPSAANASAHGATRFCATACTVNCSGLGGASVGTVVAVAAGVGLTLGLAALLPPEPPEQAATVRTDSRITMARRRTQDTVPSVPLDQPLSAMHTDDTYSICISKNVSLRFAILGLLAEEPLHGYEVKGRFERMLGGTWEVNIGQVYTTLQRLERDGLIEASGGRGDRNKLAYRATGAGHDAFLEWLAHPDDEPQQLRESIYVKLLLALRQRDGVALALLSRQHRLHLQRLRDLAVLEEQAVRDGRDDLVLLFRGAALHTEADLKWVESCRDALAQRREG